MAIIGARDRELIIAQCNNQRATCPEDIAGFALAYADAKLSCLLGWMRIGKSRHGGHGDCYGDMVNDLILGWAVCIDSRNRNGWRLVPVIFSNMQRGLSPDLIPQAMERFCVMFADMEFPTSIDVYREFEKIHPLSDVNGRVGHVLWAIYEYFMANPGERKWPMKLPPNIFS